MADKGATVAWASAEVVTSVAAVGLLINVTSELLPKPFTEPWVAWPGLLLVLAAVVGLTVRRVRQSALSPIEELERQRRHDELTPQFEITHRRSQGSDDVTLHLAFVGPPGLDQLDGVEVVIRDDRPDRRPIIAGGPTAKEIASVIWGPYRLRPGVDGADQTGRHTPAVPLRRGEALYRLLEPSLAPHWSADPVWWRHQYAGQPVRLTLTCTRQDEPPWVLTVEVTIPLMADDAVEHP